MKKQKHGVPLVARILIKSAAQVGATVVTEPEWNFAGQITFKSGRRRYFRDTAIDLNSLGASAVAKDKDHANFFMRGMGYPTVPGMTFYSDDWARIVDPERTVDAGWRYAKEIGLPVIVKPNSGTGGNGVELVHTKAAFYRAMRAIFRKDKVALVQQLVRGNDYRIVVLDDNVISAYERIPLSVVGTGVDTIAQLLDLKLAEYNQAGRDTNIKRDDPRIVAKLRRTGLTPNSLPTAGERVFLLDNANLSSGGDSRDVTAAMHAGFRELAVKVTADMGLRLCGVDVMIDGEIDQAPGIYWILEVNSAPGLDHYVMTGEAQERIVEKLYLQVLKGMDR